MKLRGVFEGYKDGNVYGWACDTDTPTNTAIVELVIDNAPVLACLADNFRGDLKIKGYHDGNHGFEIEVPVQYLDSAPHKVSMRFKGADIELQNSPKMIVLGHRTPNPVLGTTTPLVPDVQVPAISLIMPTYNRSAIMERSVRAYTRCLRWDEAELIVVNDGSRDDTSDRLAKLCNEHKNIRTVSIDNSGPARARNVAASMANAPILLFVGDDVEPANPYFIDAHLQSHMMFPDRGAAVLGKITWPSRSDSPVNFVMQHVQGDGQQQFGYKAMEPYRWYNWKLFYSSNVSVKREIISDWLNEGFDESFNEYGFEDAELGFRLTQRQNAQGQNFQLLYVPTAVLAHDHPHSVSSFIRRQQSCGFMARRFFEKHPQIAPEIGIHEMNEKLREPVSQPALPIEHYFSVFEGLKSWALILEQHNGLGSQNWHGDFLKAVFRLAYCEGYLRTVARSDVNLPLAARSVLERTIGELNQAIFREIIGSMPPPKLV